MTSTMPVAPTGRLALWAETAADLMTPNPVSIRALATVRDALRLLTQQRFSAAAVIDEAGRPVGVLSQTDLLIHQREHRPPDTEVHDYYGRTDLSARHPIWNEFPLEAAEDMRVRDLMTPAVFSVPPDASAARVVREMLELRVHCLSVVDRDGILVGVISALDVLRHLKDA